MTCGFKVLLRVRSGRAYQLVDASCTRERGHLGFHVMEGVGDDFEA